MCFKVPLQLPTRKGAQGKRTSVRTFPWLWLYPIVVRHNVSLQVARVTTCIVTLLTQVGLVAGVGHQVLGQLAHLGERTLIALETAKWLLDNLSFPVLFVRLHVSLQASFLSSCKIAVVATEGGFTCVSHFMPPQLAIMCCGEFTLRTLDPVFINSWWLRQFILSVHVIYVAF